MSESYDQKLCEKTHKDTDKTLDDHENRLNNHSKRLDVLEQDNRENHIEIKNLIKKMDTFITIIMWGLGIFVTISIFIIGVLIKK